MNEPICRCWYGSTMTIIRRAVKCPIHGTAKYRQYVREPVTYASGGVVKSEVKK